MVRPPRSTIISVSSSPALVYPYCPEHNIPIASQTPDRIADQITAEHPGMVTILSPVVRQKKGTYQQLLRDLNKEGYTRVRVNKTIIRTDEEIDLDRYKKQDIEIVIDRLETSDRSRLTEAVENALKKSEGLILVIDEAEMESTYSSLMACPVCGIAFEELQPRMFSFNSPFGACGECHGLGVKMEFDPDLIIPDKKPVHCRRGSGSLPQPDGRFPWSVPCNRCKTLRFRCAHPHTGPHRGAVQRPDVWFFGTDEVLHEYEERGRPLVAYRRVGRTPPPDGTVVFPDPVRLPQA